MILDIPSISIDFPYWMTVKMTIYREIFKQAMFDYQRVYPIKSHQ